MQKFVHWLRKDQSGFTLIELLVVVGILALLGAVAVPKVIAAQTQAKAKAAEANEGIILAALEQYYIINSAYPEEPVAPAGIESVLTKLEIANVTKMLAKFDVAYDLGTGGTPTVTVSPK